MNAETLNNLARLHCQNGSYSWMQKPFRCGDWVVVTEGHAIVSFKGIEGEWDATDRENVVKTINYENGDDVIQVERLKEFVGAYEQPKPCEICQGRGYIVCDECNSCGEIDCECEDCGHEHTRRCRKCNGRGGDQCPRGCNQRVMRCGVIDGHLYDLNLLQPFIHACPNGEAKISTIVEGHHRLQIGSDDWKCIVMGCRGELLPEYPRFEVRKAR